jgi:ABC-type multidrug transport system fused ATPase/permease subunit
VQGVFLKGDTLRSSEDRHERSEKKTMNSSKVSGGNIKEAAAVGDVECEAHRRAWESFGSDAVQIIPILKAHMAAVTQETERAAMELMGYLQVLASSSAAITATDKAASLSKVVMAMQFQDITRQKLEHVGSALDQLQQHVQVLLKGPLTPQAKQEIAALQRVERSYTMDAERRLHEAAVMSDYLDPVPSDMETADGEEDPVTLF